MGTLQEDLWPIFTDHVIGILTNPHEREWTIQGFGMMRTYLDVEQTWRLNVWHPELMVPGVSVVHDHPWHFDSWILGGELTNIRYVETHEPAFAKMFHVCDIHTGIESTVKDAGGREMPAGTTNCQLYEMLPEAYKAWNYYHQDADEIHKTTYTHGTVTLNRRSRVGEGNRARVFWPHGEEWVSAKPRIATAEEMRKYAQLGLAAIMHPTP